MILKGLDTLEFGLEIANYEKVFLPYLSKFKELKELSHITGIEYEYSIGDLNLTVHRNGQKFYAYRLSCKDFSIAFMEKAMNSNPPVFVRFMSSYLWSYGFYESYERFLSWFENFQVAISKNKLSRADICVDSDKFKICKSDIEGVITRARNKTEHFVSEEFTKGRIFSGFTIGGGNSLLARIYLKSLEIKKSGKVWFKEIWMDNDWAPEKDVWRVEFQLRRPVLKELSVDTIEQLNEKMSELWSYLTQEWLTIRQPKKDNTSRWKIKKKWRLIQTASKDYEATPLIRSVIKQGDIVRLLNQAAGLQMSIAAIGNHETTKETAHVINAWLETKLHFEQTNFEDQKEKRQRKFISDNYGGITHEI
ncbi:replication initiation factor [Paenibacillus glycanilyticus]|uniref:Replication initiation factor n=1 Tax=Paenibacillus glycanilyticus TaxID=126569 RepID=A0ABQ6GBI5_9BACL|nr:replication initiation factor [Paenibacillus glycanilyticus]GLX68319.1 hypothetical protein MU1_26640 [Paenibacillus glycanilyticus]